MAAAPAATAETTAPSQQQEPNSKDSITCHVLDTTKGKPARGMRVRLELTAPPAGNSSPASSSLHHGSPGAPRTFESQTDDDGRVKTWLPYSADNASGEVPVYTLDDVLDEISAAAPDDKKTPSRWTLRFDTAAYFAGEGTATFFPEVAVVFEVLLGQHYHVPLLLSPYSYTTYRGS